GGGGAGGGGGEGGGGSGTAGTARGSTSRVGASRHVNGSPLRSPRSRPPGHGHARRRSASAQARTPRSSRTCRLSCFARRGSRPESIRLRGLGPAESLAGTDLGGSEGPAPSS